MDDDLPFSGLTVFDAAQGVAGPHCGFLLAQHGATVIKVEPIDGDWGRKLGKTYGEHCAFSVMVNRGKQSISLDLKNPEALAIAKELASKADVVLESFRPGVMKRFGLDYGAVSAVNPSVVYLSVSGFGQTGPNSKLPVTDSVMQAFSGFMSINKDASGTPQRFGMIAIDVMTGLYAFQAVSAALYRRLRTGKGKHIDCSLMASVGAFQMAKMIEFHKEGDEIQAPGVPVGTFRTLDGYININARRDHHYASLCKIMERPDLATDPRFSTYEGRVANEAALMAIVREATAQKPTAFWSEALNREDVLNAAVFSYGDYFADPHVKEFGAISWMTHPEIGEIPVTVLPGIDTAPAGTPLSHAPSIGAQTHQVLASLGRSQADLARLADAGAIRIATPMRAAAE
jgi:crotonobetainyl-CoA:carnitine CoA-transferase CaiB-like acyl-CoA transferase